MIKKQEVTQSPPGITLSVTTTPHSVTSYQGVVVSLSLITNVGTCAPSNGPEKGHSVLVSAINWFSKSTRWIR